MKLSHCFLILISLGMSLVFSSTLFAQSQGSDASKIERLEFGPINPMLEPHFFELRFEFPTRPDTGLWRETKKLGKTIWMTQDSLLMVSSNDSKMLFVMFDKKLTQIPFDTSNGDVMVSLIGDSVTIITERSIKFKLSDVTFDIKVIVPLKRFVIPTKAVEMLRGLPFQHPLLKKLDGVLEATDEKSKHHEDEI